MMLVSHILIEYKLINGLSQVLHCQLYLQESISSFHLMMVWGDNNSCVFIIIRIIIINISNSLCIGFSYIICNICLLRKIYVLNLSEIKVIIIEIAIVLFITWLFTTVIYFSIIVINMFYMFISLFSYILFIIDMVMPCDIISYITCIIYFLCKILIVCGNKCKMYYYSWLCCMYH